MFMISSIIQAHFYLKFNPIWVSKKKTRKNLWVAWGWNQAKISLSAIYKTMKFYKKNSFYGKEEVNDWTNEKICFLTALA